MTTDLMAILPRIPLAEATWRLWDHVFPDPDLKQFYDHHRGACYQKAFAFEHLVALTRDALGRHRGHAHPTLQDHANSDQCPASEQAFYGKLRRMPIPLSEAFLAEGAQRLASWVAEPANDLPASLQAFRTLIIDGKTIKNAAKRLVQLRGRAGRGLGGKLLVALEPATGLVVGMAADPDGHAHEAKLVPRLLPQIRERSNAVHLWVADQGFGDLAQFRRCTASGDHCVLRLHPKSVFVPDSQVKTQRGRDALQRHWNDEIGTLQSSREGTAPVRRITLERPDDKPLVIVTDLLDRETYPANDLLDLYRQRWGIEQVFQKITEVFHLEHLIGSHPQAMIFQASLCLMMYNLLQVVRGWVAQTQAMKAEEVSTQNVWRTLQEQWVTMFTLASPADWLAALRQRSADVGDLKSYLRDQFQKAWKPSWKKSPAKKHHALKVKHRRGTAGHFSIHKALQEPDG